MDDDGNPYFIAIGASGGEGLHDIIDVLRALPRPLFAVVTVVLHRPSEGISYLRRAYPGWSIGPAKVCDIAQLKQSANRPGKVGCDDQANFVGVMPPVG